MLPGMRARPARGLRGRGHRGKRYDGEHQVAVLEFPARGHLPSIHLMNIHEQLR